MELYGARWEYSPLEWVPFRENYTYAPREVHIFLACVADNQGAGDRYLSFLPPEEHASCVGAEADVLRSQKLLSLAMKYFVCSACLKVPVQELRFTRTRDGKPGMLSPESSTPLYFSQSHTDAYVVMSVSDTPCGVDVERLRGPSSYPRLSQKGLPLTWSRELRNQECSAEQARLFTRYWTALESLYKIDGKGSLKRFVRELYGEETPSGRGWLSGTWGAHFEVGNGHLACVTLGAKPSRLAGFRVSLPGVVA